MRVKDFLETITLKDYFAISISELVESREYSSGELSIVIYDPKNIINMLSDTILNKTISHTHVDISDDNEIELYIYVLKATETKKIDKYVVKPNYFFKGIDDILRDNNDSKIVLIFSSRSSAFNIVKNGECYKGMSWYYGSEKDILNNIKSSFKNISIAPELFRLTNKEEK